MVDRDADFEGFVTAVEPRLRAALVGLCGPDLAREAVQDALVHAWQQWPRAQSMANPVGYLDKVARSRIAWPRPRRAPLPQGTTEHLPEVEPALSKALGRLSERQRVVVFLTVGCEWTLREVAELLGLSVSSVRNHLDRGLTRLRRQLGVSVDA